MVEEQYQRALQLLTDNQDKLQRLAEKLLEKEVIFKEDLIEIFGKRPWDKEETVDATITTHEQEISEEEVASSTSEETTESPAEMAGEQETTNEELDQSNSEQQDAAEDKTGE